MIVIRHSRVLTPMAYTNSLSHFCVAHVGGDRRSPVGVIVGVIPAADRQPQHATTSSRHPYERAPTAAAAAAASGRNGFRCGAKPLHAAIASGARDCLDDALLRAYPAAARSACHYYYLVESNDSSLSAAPLLAKHEHSDDRSSFKSDLIRMYLFVVP
jgi:hypothetical protein